MTDDNTIDIGNHLPPIEVRKPWRHKLPSYYAAKIDTLKDSYNLLDNLIKVLASIRRNFPDNDVSGHYEMELAAKQISEAVVLLECAKDKLWQTVPVEEFMSPEELKEFGRS